MEIKNNKELEVPSSGGLVICNNSGRCSTKKCFHRVPHKEVYMVNYNIYCTSNTECLISRPGMCSKCIPVK